MPRGPHYTTVPLRPSASSIMEEVPWKAGTGTRNWASLPGIIYEGGGYYRIIRINHTLTRGHIPPPLDLSSFILSFVSFSPLPFPRLYLSLVPLLLSLQDFVFNISLSPIPFLFILPSSCFFPSLHLPPLSHSSFMSTLFLSLCLSAGDD